MTAKDNLEGKLEELANAIATDDSIVEDVMSRIGQSGKMEKSNNKLLLRRFIMNRFSKLAAAAVVIVAAVISITFLGKLTAPVYALEQTIEALKNVRYMHIVRRGEAGQVEDERWIEIGPDGVQARYRQDTPPNFLVVDNLENIFIYHKDKNTVLLYGPDGQRYTWIWNLGEFLEDLAGGGSMTIEKNVDYWGSKAHRVRWLKSNQDCYIDPETKLPIAMGAYEISYEEPPEATFDIPTIPGGVTLVDKRPGAPEKPEPEWMRRGEVAQQKFNEARKASAQGEYEKAVELFRRVVEIQPLRNWAWFWMGRAHYELREHNAAICEFSKVIDMFGKLQAVPHYCHLARGFAYASKGMEEMARQDFQVALPVMIDALRHIEAGRLFDFADDPLRCGGGLLEGCHESPGKEQSLAMMINRLRITTGQDFGYDPKATAQQNEQAIVGWEQWFKDSGEIKFTPDAELVAVPDTQE